MFGRELTVSKARSRSRMSRIIPSGFFPCYPETGRAESFPLLSLASGFATVARTKESPDAPSCQKPADPLCAGRCPGACAGRRPSLWTVADDRLAKQDAIGHDDERFGPFWCRVARIIGADRAGSTQQWRGIGFLGELRVKDPQAYREAAKVGLRPLLPIGGKVALQKLRRRDIEAERDRLSQKYKPSTVRACLRPLGSALSWAIPQELIAQSPMTKIPLPRRQYSTDRLSKEEAKRLLEVAKQRAQSKRPAKLHYSLFIGVSLAIRLGLRRGEVFGLRWQDVDLVNYRLTVARSYEGLPKNGKARVLPIPLPLAQELTEWKALCAPSLLVCPLGKMGMIAFQKLLSAADCPYFARPWHALRHTFASLLIEQGGNILALKELLGHSSLDMSLIYSHLAPGALAGEVGKIKL